MKKILNFLSNINIYGWTYVLTYFPIKLYFSQHGKKVGRYTYEKISLRPIKDAYFYGYAKDNPYWY